PPPEGGEARWTNEGVLLRAAADPRFAAAKADLLLRDAGELFQMCAAVFEADLRSLFRAAVGRWAGPHYRRLTEGQIEQVVPDDVRPRLSPDQTRTQLLREAAGLCEAADAADGGRRLMALYANVAGLVYPFEQAGRGGP